MRLIMLILTIWLYAQFDVVKQKAALPDEVETEFIEKFPSAENISWDKRNGVYEIDFMMDGMVQCEYYHPGKGFLEQETEDIQPTADDCDTSCTVR